MPDAQRVPPSKALTGAFLQQENINLSLIDKKYISHIIDQKGFKSTVVNRALTSLSGGSLNITQTVPLISMYVKDCLSIFIINLQTYF